MAKKSMTWILKVTVLALAIVPGAVRAEDETLESRLNELELPSNVAPSGVTQEKLYSVQSRYSSLKKRSEVTIGYAKNFTGSSFLDMTQVEGAYRFHFNDRWNAALSGAYGFNSLTSGGKRLLAEDGILPDAPFVKSRFDALVGYNLFYGKFRLSMDKVLYFDQYVAFGPGYITTQYASSPAAVLDVGFVFWMGRNFSFRFGVKNDFFKEESLRETKTAHHALGHLSVGYAFGSGERL